MPGIAVRSAALVTITLHPIVHHYVHWNSLAFIGRYHQFSVFPDQGCYSKAASTSKTLS
jgi:hypothetical protein